MAKSTKQTKQAHIVPVQLHRIRQDVTTRKEAINEAERAYNPFRVKLQQMYHNTAENAHVKACVERRKDLTMLRKWEFRNLDKSVNKQVTELFCDSIGGQTMNKEWFNNFVDFTLDALFYGYTLVSIGDVINNQLKGVDVVKRWHVSPDRFEITSFAYMPNGISFIDGEYENSYIYVSTPSNLGATKCGLGLYWELSIYEIFARNLLGFNGDYIEVNIAPFRQMKTTKTNEAERAMAEGILRDMGTSGYAVTDMMDEIIFHNSGGSGTGYNAYDQFEKRLESAISKLVLGHENAISAKPSALGNGGDQSPEQIALNDKQTKDGAFITSIVNNVLIPKLRAIGLMIPEGVTAIMLNDNEEMDNANNLVDLAVKMKNAGLQIDGKYFTSKTNIPLTEIVAPMKQDISKGIQDKLNKLYS